MSRIRGMDKEDETHIHNGILLGHKNEIMPFATRWIDLEMTILSEVGQTEEDKYQIISLLCGI